MTGPTERAAAPARESAKASNVRLLLALPVLLAVAIGLQVGRDRIVAATPLPAAALWFSSPAAIKRMALGYDNIVADVYWMRAVNYYGGQRLKTDGPPNYDVLYQMLELVTALDPRFNIAYRFGAIFLAEAYPSGPGRPDQAIALLQRGIDATGRWEYMHDIGFVHYWWLHDYPQAATWFLKAADVPGAPAYLRPLAATTLAKGGDRRSARLLWQQVLNSDAEWLRGNAEFRLKQLDAMDMLDILNAGARQFAARAGRPPRSWQELATVVRLNTVPLDPGGAPFALDPSSGTVHLAPDSPLQPLPNLADAPPEPVPPSQPAQPTRPPS